MSHTTHMLILDPVNPERVRGQLDDMLARRANFAPAWEHDRDTWPAEPCWFTTPGQGLPALTLLRYAVDAPLEWDDETDPVQYLLRVTFDTAYGWEGPRGERCKELHDALCQELAWWMGDAGVRGMVR